MFRPTYPFDWFLSASSSARAWGEIAMYAPMVVALRSARMSDPLRGMTNQVESMRMVTEKVAAAAESSFEAVRVANEVTGAAMLGRARLDAPFAIAEAAARPVGKRVKANVRRLSTGR